MSPSRRPAVTRPSDPVPESPIQTFWRWWAAGVAQQMAAATGSQSKGDLANRMTDRVRAIHPELQWEIGPGDRAAHVLSVTGSGAARLRAVTQRWRDAAPAEDSAWQFAAARTRHRDLGTATLRLEGHHLDLASTRATVELDERRQLFDVVVHHPGFVDLAERGRRQFALIALGWALGEDDLERWVGSVDTESGPARDGSALADVVVAVDTAAANLDGPTWVRQSGTTSAGVRGSASVRYPLRWVDHPLLDQHVAVTLEFDAEQQADGMPTGPALRRLGTLQNELVAAVGDGAQLVAHETSQGRRILHLYTDREDAGVAALVDGWVEETPGAELRREPDPAWRAVRQLS